MYIHCNLRDLDVWPTIILTGDSSHYPMLDKNNANREQGEVTMAGLIFALSILSILTTVGFLFAWMVRLASTPEQNQNVLHGELSTSTIAAKRR